MKIRWGNKTWEEYKPKKNKKRVALLGGLMIGDIILPATFGLGIIASKLILKLNPMFLYK